MLYTIFLYQSKSGLLLYTKNFQEISSGKMDLFSSFFSALKAFIEEMILDGSKELKNIELGEYTVLITSINEIEAELVIIGDRDDDKVINKLIPRIIKVLIKHSNVFLDWKGNRSDFEILDQPISDLILSQKKLLGDKSLLDRQEHILKSIWEYKKDLSPKEIEDLNHEKEILMERLENSNSLPKKLELTENLLKISEKLKSDQDFIIHQEEIKEIRDQIRDSKLKLSYFLEKIKITINQAINQLGTKALYLGDYKDVYLNLYSFSNKLKNMTDSNSWVQYRDLAQKLINKDENDSGELSQAISKILKMSDNIEDYFD
ncbi:MAG: hypothetical protein ACFFDK_07450 [Promethearchaeota archaeon]